MARRGGLPAVTDRVDDILDPLPEMAGDLADLYRDLHRHPELSMCEHRTAAIAARRLTAAGFAVTAGVGGTGVVGVLRNGDGPVVMLRADMDALPMREDSGLDYASTAMGTDPTGATVPVAHSCGHDMHVTWLAGGRRTARCRNRALARHGRRGVPAGRGDRPGGPGHAG